jgi:hypothetical protein
MLQTTGGRGPTAKSVELPSIPPVAVFLVFDDDNWVSGYGSVTVTEMAKL